MEKLSDMHTKSSGKNGKLNLLAKIIGNFIFVVVVSASLLFIFFMLQSRLTGTAPSFWRYKLFVVMSGSMEPVIHTGSLAIVKEVDASTLATQDVITYRNLDLKKNITHRIVEVSGSGDKVAFTTRGDANNVNDAMPIRREDIVGKFVFSIPLVGYLLDFARTGKGVVFLLIIPGALIFIYELRKLFQYLVLADREKQAEKRRMEQEIVEKAK